ncbi:hypothetical protein EDB89DRAFT_2013548 [Lactarius sanguifluus]|nr:hypothetical protein EDB89DRAFT_2013548 [Lactarius sanguifluus]
MTNLNLLRRFLIVSILLSTGTCSATQSQPPSCAISCTSSTASQIGCDMYVRRHPILAHHASPYFGTLATRSHASVTTPNF